MIDDISVTPSLGAADAVVASAGTEIPASTPIDGNLEGNTPETPEVATPDSPVDYEAQQRDLETYKKSHEALAKYGGPEKIGTVAGFYDALQNAEPDVAAKTLADRIYQFDPVRYQALANEIYEAHRDSFRDGVLSDLGVTIEQIQKLKDGTLEEKSELDLDLDLSDSRDAEIARHRKTERDRASAEKVQVEQASARELDGKYAALDTACLQPVEDLIAGLKFGEGHDLASDMIRLAAVKLFNSDTEARNHYDEARKLIKQGVKPDSELLASRQWHIHEKAKQYAQQAVDYLGGLIKGKAQTQLAKAVATVQNPSVPPDIGAMPKVASDTPLPGKPFSKDRIDARIAALEASGRFK